MKVAQSVDWGTINRVAQSLQAVPDRWAIRGRRRPDALPSRAEMALGLELAGRGLQELQPALHMQAWAADPDLWQFVHVFGRALPDLRALPLDDLKRFAADNERDFAELAERLQCDALTLVANALAARLTGLAREVVGSSPGYYMDDPERIRDLALAWLEDHSALLSDFALAGCMRSMVSCHGLGAIPLAQRLFHDPAAGPRVKRAIEEEFVPEVFAQIRAATPR